MLHRDPTLHCVELRHALCDVPTAVGHSSTPRGRWHAHCRGALLSKFLESPTLASQGSIAPFCASGVSRPIAPLRHWGIYIVEHHPHTRLSSGHGFDTNWRTWAPSQKTSLLGGVAQIFIYPRSSLRLADVGLFVRPISQQRRCVCLVYIVWSMELWEQGRQHIYGKAIWRWWWGADNAQSQGYIDRGRNYLCRRGPRESGRRWRIWGKHHCPCFEIVSITDSFLLIFLLSGLIVFSLQFST